MNTSNVTAAYASYEAKASQNTTETKKTTGNYGRTVGKPKLSEKAAAYYEELKKKFSDMDFVLVSDDKKQEAEAHASAYANANKTVVLINESKIEEMANDETVRAKYEGILSSSKSQFSQMASQIAGTGAEVQGYGIRIDDNGNAKYFAVLKQSSDAQKARIEKRAEEKKAEKKEAERRAEKKEEAEKTHDRKTDQVEDDTVTISANSIEELIQKISDYTFTQRADSIQTEAELNVGQHIDFKG